MSDTTSPEAVSDAPLSMAEAINAIKEPEPDEDSQEQPESEEADDGETPDDAPVDDDEGVEEGAEDETAEASEDEADEPDEYASGRFAADTARVTLADGSTATVAELKQGYLRTADYTKKTQATAEERKALETTRAEVQQLERQIAEQRQLVQTFAQKLMPQAPSREMMDTDPLGYMQAKADYDDQVARIEHLGSIQRQEEQRRAAETAEETRSRQLHEAQKLQEVMPELKDPATYSKFFQGAVQTMQQYGYTAEDVAGAMDHRLYPIFRDLNRLQRMLAAKPKVEAKVEGKPPVMRGSKRLSPDQQKARSSQAALDRLTKTGSPRDAVAALMALDN